MKSPLPVAIGLMIVALAGRLLPARRAEWAEAMRREFLEISHPSEAVEFALGCLCTSAIERTESMKNWVIIGRWATAAGAMLFAAFLFWVVIQSFIVLQSGTYPYYERLLSQGEFAAAETHRTVFSPLMVAWMGLVGVAFIGASFALLRRKRRTFFVFCGFAAGVVTLVVAPALMLEPRAASLFAVMAALPIALLFSSGLLLGRLERAA